MQSLHCERGLRAKSLHQVIGLFLNFALLVTQRLHLGPDIHFSRHP